MEVSNNFFILQRSILLPNFFQAVLPKLRNGCEFGLGAFEFKEHFAILDIDYFRRIDVAVCVDLKKGGVRHKFRHLLGRQPFLDVIVFPMETDKSMFPDPEIHNILLESKIFVRVRNIERYIHVSFPLI